MDKLFFLLLFTLCINVINGQAILDVDRLLSHSFSDVNLAELEALDAEVAFLNRDKGLRFNSSVTKNDFAELENGSAWRMNAGVQFNLFQDGIYERRKRVVITQNTKEIKKTELKLQEQERNYAYVYNYMIYSFNKEKRKVLDQKKFLLTSLINKNFELYYNHELSYDEILYLKGLNEECDLLLMSMTQVDNLFEQLVDVASLPALNAAELPIMKFHTDSLLSFDPYSYMNEILALKKENVKQNIALENQRRLSFYVNVHSRPTLADAAIEPGMYSSLGVRYQTPLHFRSKQADKLLALRENVEEARFEDVKFNHNKELINLILDYNTKLRQYSNFQFKLEKLYEKRRVESAVQNVSTLRANSVKNWSYDLEILNVTYELVELKQLIYLSLLRIYNKAKLPSLLPFISEIIFDGSQKRFYGKRVLKISMKQLETLDKKFIISYLHKNNFDYILCIDAVNCEELVGDLYRLGINFYDNADAIAQDGLVIVPVSRFSSRSEMELWIEDQLKSHPQHFLMFEKIEQLVELDNKTLGE